MQVEVKELGARPRLQTPGRENAPAAAIQLARIFERPGNNWADNADIVLDWQNTLLESDEPDLQYPVLLIATSKYVSGKGFLVAQSRLNIDSVFTGDYVTGEVLADIVEELRITTLNKLEEAGELN